MRRTGPAATLLATFLSLVLAGQALGVTWATPITLTAAGDGNIYGRALATSAGATHVIYGSGGIRYRQSMNLGGSWSRPAAIALDSDTVTTSDRAIAAYGRLVVVTYTTYSTTDRWTLYVRRSLDGGVSWKPRLALASYTSDAGMGGPSVAVGSTGVHVAWTDGRDGRIFYRRSVDGGATFLRRVALALTTRELPGSIARNGAVAVTTSRNLVYVAWSPSDAADDHCSSSLVMRRSANGGASFFPMQYVDRRATPDVRGLSASGSTLLAGYALCDGRVVVARSTDSGGQFVRTTVAGTAGVTHLWWADVHLTGTTARLVYSQLTIASNDKLFLRTSADGGATWSPASSVASAIDIAAPSVVGTASAVLVSYGKADYVAGTSLGVFTRKGTLP